MQQSPSYLNKNIIRYLQHDSDFQKVFEEFTAAPWRSNHLDTKTKEFINIALSASPTHLNKEAVRFHIKQALEANATQEEIAEVLKIVSILGVHTCAVGIPIMMEHFRHEENVSSKVVYTSEQQELKERFIATMGYWNDFRDDLIHMDTAYFKAYYDFLTIPTRRGILEPKIIEFIYIAIDSSTTHLFEKGIEVHIKNAIQVGATQGELLEVFQLTSALGFHTLLDMLPILEEEIAKKIKLIKG